MGQSITINGGYIVAEVDLHSNDIYAIGSSQLPVLLVSLNFLFRQHKDFKTGLDFKELRCRVVPLDGSPHNHPIAFSLPSPLRVRVKPGEEINNQYVQLEIPLDQDRIAFLNRLRKGQDVRLRLNMELMVDEMIELGPIPEKHRGSAWAHVDRHRGQTDFNVTISRSRWVEQVLSATGFGHVHIIELPTLPTESYAGIKKCAEALQQAQKLEREGYYDEAVARCRIALEPFFEHVDKTDGDGVTRKVPILKTSWEKKIGNATYDWLNTSLVAVKQATNEPHHRAYSIYDQLEAQMLLTVTTAVVAYAARTQSEIES